MVLCLCEFLVVGGIIFRVDGYLAERLILGRFFLLFLYGHVWLVFVGHWTCCVMYLG